MNMKVEDVDLGGVVLADAVYRDNELTFAGAGTVIAGTILARDSATLKMVPFVIGGAANDNGIPKAILTYDVTAEAAGDLPIRAGIEGKFRLDKLVVDADGDASNITAKELDELRAYGLVSIDVEELNIPDNQ